MTNQSAAEHDIRKIRALGGSIGKVRTAGDDLRSRRPGVAGVNTEYHCVIVSVFFLIKACNMTQHANHSILKSVSFVGTYPFFIPALALEQGSFLNCLGGDGFKAGQSEEADFSASSFCPL